MDFDDTLVRTGAMVIVNHANGVTEEMTPGEYAIYDPQHGDQFNYSQFDGPLINPRQIGQVFNAFKKDLLITTHNKIVLILTARGAQKPLRDYLTSIGIDPKKNRNLRIATLGSGDPQHKAGVIAALIEKKGFDDVEFFDDSVKNRDAVAALADIPRYSHARIEVKPYTWENEDLNEKKKKEYNDLALLHDSDYNTDDNMSDTIEEVIQLLTTNLGNKIKPFSKKKLINEITQRGFESRLRDGLEDFSNIDMRGLDLGGRDLSDLDFSGANLRGVNLSGANLMGTSFRNANLTDADLEDSEFDEDTNVDGTIMSREQRLYITGDDVGPSAEQDNERDYDGNAVDLETMSKERLLGLLYSSELNEPEEFYAILRNPNTDADIINSLWEESPDDEAIDIAIAMHPSADENILSSIQNYHNTTTVNDIVRRLRSGEISRSIPPRESQQEEPEYMQGFQIGDSVQFYNEFNRFIRGRITGFEDNLFIVSDGRDTHFAAPDELSRSQTSSSDDQEIQIGDEVEYHPESDEQTRRGQVTEIEDNYDGSMAYRIKGLNDNSEGFWYNDDIDIRKVSSNINDQPTPKYQRGDVISAYASQGGIKQIVQGEIQNIDNDRIVLLLPSGNRVNIKASDVRDVLKKKKKKSTKQSKHPIQTRFDMLDMDDDKLTTSKPKESSRFDMLDMEPTDEDEKRRQQLKAMGLDEQRMKRLIKEELLNIKGNK